jgi:hypothetical protein
MSVLPATDPACTQCPSTPAIEHLIDARPRDIEGFKVGRLLPSLARRLSDRSSSSTTWARRGSLPARAWMCVPTPTSGSRP